MDRDYIFDTYRIDKNVQKSYKTLVDVIVSEINRDVTGQLPINKFSIVFVKDISPYLARYIAGTYNEPSILLDIELTKSESDRAKIGIDVAILTSILHEIAHAIQEMYGLDMDEGQAEDFAETYYRTGQVDKFWEKETDAILRMRMTTANDVVERLIIDKEKAHKEPEEIKEELGDIGVSEEVIQDTYDNRDKNLVKFTKRALDESRVTYQELEEMFPIEVLRKIAKDLISDQSRFQMQNKQIIGDYFSTGYVQFADEDDIFDMELDIGEDGLKDVIREIDYWVGQSLEKIGIEDYDVDEVCMKVLSLMPVLDGYDDIKWALKRDIGLNHWSNNNLDIVSGVSDFKETTKHFLNQAETRGIFKDEDAEQAIRNRELEQRQRQEKKLNEEQKKRDEKEQWQRRMMGKVSGLNKTAEFPRLEVTREEFLEIKHNIKEKFVGTIVVDDCKDVINFLYEIYGHEVISVMGSREDIYYDVDMEESIDTLINIIYQDPVKYLQSSGVTIDLQKYEEQHGKLSRQPLLPGMSPIKSENN